MCQKYHNDILNMLPSFDLNHDRRHIARKVPGEIYKMFKFKFKFIYFIFNTKIVNKIYQAGNQYKHIF